MCQVDDLNQAVCIMKWTLEMKRLLLYVGYANKVVIIVGLVKIGIELIRPCDICM